MRKAAVRARSVFAVVATLRQADPQSGQPGSMPFEHCDRPRRKPLAWSVYQTVSASLGEARASRQSCPQPDHRASEQGSPTGSAARMRRIRQVR